ncbi:Ig-like domain-containing protein [Maribacter sp. 2304DJ31-5]|uniref:Ig-like domain-containing protein n=1 Tax=Maribacter sp. 2304DJ31-5 TaxID=3386273 RepID=UPI0039BC5E61
MTPTKYLFVMVLTVMIFNACSTDPSDTGLVDCNGNQVETLVTEIELDQSRINLKKGDVLLLSVTTDIGDDSVTWVSDSPEIAQVDNQGEVTALKSGSAIITAKTCNAETTATLSIDPDIYITGSEIMTTESFSGSLATYWKNGKKVTLSNLEQSSNAHSIFKEEGTLYVAGQQRFGLSSQAKYWTQDSETSLTSGEGYAIARSIFVDGGDVYVTGTEKFSSGNTIAKYWINGQEFPLTDGSNRAFVSSIYVANGDVYVAGTEQNGATPNRYVAKYWKNNQEFILTDGTDDAGVRDIVVIGNDVYVAGTEGSVVKYWKNGEAVSLSDGFESAAAHSIHIDGDDIYVAGYEYGNGSFQEAAVYWKNDEKFVLTNGVYRSYIADITVHNGNVYAVGAVQDSSSEPELPVYWKDGERNTLPVVSGGRGNADSIFLD